MNQQQLQRVLPGKPGPRWTFYGDAVAFQLHLKYPRLFPQRQHCILVFGALLLPVIVVLQLLLLQSYGIALVLVCFSFMLLLWWCKKNSMLWKSTQTIARGWIEHRLDANPTARDAYLQDDSSIHIIDSLYDMFLPKSSSSSSQSDAMVALIFIPGALIDARAYGGICHNISQQGNVLVILLHTEKYRRLPMPFVGLNESAIRHVMRHATRELTSLFGRSHRVREWCLGGHSLGAHTAQELILKLPEMSKLVQWGVYSHLHDPSSLKIPELIVTASCDGFRSDKPPPSSSTTTSPRVQRYEVEGGNHSGFGDYPPQMYPKPDGERTIPLAEQHAQVARVTAQFLLS